MFRFLTLRTGDRIAVWSINGSVRYVDGPRRMILFRESLQRLQRHRASADEYLDVEFADGHREHVRGPCSVWYDPVAHRNIEVRKALPLDSHEAIVVYRRSEQVVQRRIERGPALFVPTEDEWLHEFSWHGADPPNSTRKVPHALRFNKLRVIPDQTYHHVEDVRTADDALLTVKLMIFFELADIERMLDQTHDPIADFINAVTADVIDFVGGRSFEQFKQQTERLNDLESYPNLTIRSTRIGYQVNKVVYRGYVASAALQAMHDGAIEARTQLKLESETEEQAQRLEDLKLARETERAEQRREMAKQQAAHELELRRGEHVEKIRRLEAERQAKAESRRTFNHIQLDHARATNEEQARFLTSMGEMQVDLTRYLVAQYQHPDRLIRIAGENGSPQLHLHDN